MAAVGSMVDSPKSDEYCVPGVEANESTRLSAGECSNLTVGLVILNIVVVMFSQMKRKLCVEKVPSSSVVVATGSQVH